MNRIVLIGDSLTEWGDWDDLLKGCRVLNFGISGETTRGLYSRASLIKSALCSGDLVFVMSGINDILMDEEDVLPYLESFVKSLFDTELKLNITLQSLLPVSGDFPQYLDIIRDNNERIYRVAMDLKVDFFDLYSSFVDKAGRPIESYFMDDGVHLSNRGYSVWAKELQRFLSEKGAVL